MTSVYLTKSNRLGTGRGFTLLEVVVVAALIGLIIVSVASVGEFKKGKVDKIKIAYLNDVVLSLEEYKNVCRFYPEDLSPDTGCGSITVGDVLPESPNPALVSIDDVVYVPLTKSSGSYGCYDAHIGIYVEDASVLDNDDDFFVGDDPDYNACPGYQDFDGNDSAQGGFYDLLLKSGL